MKRKVTLALAVLAVAALCALGGVCLTYPIQLDPVSYTHLDVYKRQS